MKVYVVSMQTQIDLAAEQEDSVAGDMSLEEYAFPRFDMVLRQEAEGDLSREQLDGIKYAMTRFAQDEEEWTPDAFGVTEWNRDPGCTPNMRVLAMLDGEVAAVSVVVEVELK